MAFISEPHFSGLNWNPHPVQPRTDTLPFISEHNFSGLNSDTRFNPPLMAFISKPHFFGVEPMPIPINMAYGDSWHQSICSPRNKPWEYKPKPNRFLVHSHCANRNEPKRTKGLLHIQLTYSCKNNHLLVVSTHLLVVSTHLQQIVDETIPLSCLSRQKEKHTRAFCVQGT